MGILHIVKTSLKKNKGNTVSFLCMVLLASLLLNIGAVALTQVNRLFSEKSKDLNSIHGAFWINQNEFNDSYFDLLAADETIDEINQEEIIYLNNAEIDFGGTYDSNSMLMNLQQERSISPVRMLSEDQSIPKELAIYLPYSAYQIGYSLGDSYTIMYKQTTYEFLVAGFFEALEFTRANDIALRCYLSSSAFEDLKAKTGVYQYISFRCFEENQAINTAKRFTDACDVTFSKMGIGNSLCDLDDFKSAITMPNYIMGGLLIGISFIIAVIVLLFLRFRLHNSIDQNMRNFGVLQAMGYTTRQILYAYTMEYGIVSFIGAILGGICSGLLLPIFQNIMSSMSGVQFAYTIDPLLILLIILILTILISLTAAVSSGRIRHFTPVMALRGGLATHNFQKNHLPLHRGISFISVHMGLKNIFIHMKSYIMIGIIVAGITIVLTFCMNMYNTFAGDNTTLVRLTGVEIADLSVTVTAQTDAAELSNAIEAMEEVAKTSMYDWITFQVEGVDVAGFCSDDFGKLDTVSFFSGTYPVLDNEIAISSALGKQLDKKTGDYLIVKAGGVTKEFLITGYFTSTNNGGRAACISLVGYQQMQPSYQQTDINIYLKAGQTVEAFREVLEQQFGRQGDTAFSELSQAQKRAEEKISMYLEQYGIDSVDYAVMLDGEILFSGSSSQNKIAKISVLRDKIDVQIGSYVSGIAMFVQMVFLISFVIVFIVVYMTVKNMIVKHSLDLGIQKAIGFETKQLMLQYTISFLPAILAGVIVGVFMGVIATNPIMNAIFSGLGGDHVSISINIVLLFFIGVGTILTSLGIVLFSTREMRHISAYELISE